MASAPISAARLASSASSTPFSTSLPGHSLRTQFTSSQDSVESKLSLAQRPAAHTPPLFLRYSSILPNDLRLPINTLSAQAGLVAISNALRSVSRGGTSRPFLMSAWRWPLRGQRHADIKNGLEVPPRLTLRNAFDIATKPAWALSVLMGRRKSFGNIDEYLKNKGGVWAAGRWANDNFDSTLSWDDVNWVRKLWPGKLVLKGVLDAEDAKRAADMGADAIVVSNHGGRQLDGAPATITALPRIADAAGDRIEILFDGGVRSGQDVLKALALGARGCMIGRAYLYGLAAMGEAGVRKALSLIGEELKVSMSLTGVRDVADVSRDILFDNPDDRRRDA